METRDHLKEEINHRDKIWFKPIKPTISYPQSGNDACYQIEDKSFWFINRNKIIYEAIRKYSIGGQIFDVGGGNGFVSAFLVNCGFDTVLVEPGIHGCNNAKKRGLENIINSTLSTSLLTTESIPNIGIFDVLEHVDNQNDFLNIIHSKLAQNGRLFITVPSFNLLWSEEDRQAGHYRRYRIKELSRLIDSTGFEIIYTSYFFSFLVFPIFIFRTIPSLFGFYKISNEKSKKQHLSNTPKLLNRVMNFELTKIIKGKRIYFGSSLLLVARKR